MTNGTFQMSVGQAQKLERAVIRNGFDASAIEFLSQGKNIDKALAALGWKSETGLRVNIKPFFQTSQTLWIDPDFTNWILNAYENEISQNSALLAKAFDLSKKMKDSEIISQAESLGFDPKQNPVTLDQIKAKIEAQPNGIEGEMLSNGFANIFYVSGKDEVLFTVNVHWNSGGGQWSVYADRLDQYGKWDAGSRIFCNKS